MCVRCHGLGLVAEQVGGPPVVSAGERLRQRAVDALLRQVVDELVVRAHADQQAGHGQLLAQPHRGQLVDADELTEEPRVDPAAQHRGALDERSPVRLQPVDPGLDRGSEGLRNAGVAGSECAQVLDDAERVTRGARQHLGGVRGQAGSSGQRLDRSLREYVETQPGRAVAEPGHRRVVLAADRPDEQDADAGQPPGQVAQQVDGGGTSVLEVVDC